MDYFKGITNEDFKVRFLTELNSITEFIQYNDPDDFFDPEQEYGDHIIKCQQNQDRFIRETVFANAAAAGISLTDDECSSIVQHKKAELFPLLHKSINKYIEIIKVTYIDPVTTVCEHKYLLHRWLCLFWKFLQSRFK
jgi:hypothetical protein